MFGHVEELVGGVQVVVEGLLAGNCRKADRDGYRQRFAVGSDRACREGFPQFVALVDRRIQFQPLEDDAELFAAEPRQEVPPGDLRLQAA